MLSFAEVDVSGLSAFVVEWQGQIVNDQKNNIQSIIIWNAETEQTLLH